MTNWGQKTLMSTPLLRDRSQACNVRPLSVDDERIAGQVGCGRLLKAAAVCWERKHGG